MKCITCLRKGEVADAQTVINGNAVCLRCADRVIIAERKLYEQQVRGES